MSLLYSCCNIEVPNFDPVIIYRTPVSVPHRCTACTVGCGLGAPLPRGCSAMPGTSPTTTGGGAVVLVVTVLCFYDACKHVNVN